MIGPSLAAVFFVMPPGEGWAQRAAATPVAGPCVHEGAAASAMTIFRRLLLRQRCGGEALAFVAAVLPTLPWDERLAALAITAEVPAGELRLGADRLALAEAILDRLGEPPANQDAARKAAFATEALFTLVCLQRDPPRAGTFADLFRRFVAAQGPDQVLVADLLAMRRIYLRWRYGIDCAAQQAEALSILLAMPEL